MAFRIVDLHSDLLSYLAHAEDRTVEDPISRSSYTQLLEGTVHTQTLAIYTPTKQGSTKIAEAQVEAFLQLPPCPVQFIPAFENASGFAEEEEPLQVVFERLEKVLNKLKKILYISLTWEEENRFGGGNRTTVGLKEDGIELLLYLSGKNIAVDLSHTSDQLAFAILSTIDQKKLQIPILASHSNFRAISNFPRNLPEELTKEIILRKGLIGLNFFSSFIHPSNPLALTDHVAYALKLGAENTLCFGADFFCDADAPNLLHKYQRTEAYYPQMENSSCYPFVLKFLEECLHLNQEILAKIAFQNAENFLESMAPFSNKHINPIDPRQKIQKTESLSPTT